MCLLSAKGQAWHGGGLLLGQMFQAGCNGCAAHGCTGWDAWTWTLLQVPKVPCQFLAQELTGGAGALAEALGWHCQLSGTKGVFTAGPLTAVRVPHVFTKC